MKKVYFLGIISLLTLFNAYLISSPSVFGKVGIWLFKYDYIKDFPSAILTLTIALLVFLSVCEIAIRFLTSKKKYIVLASLAASSIGLLAYLVNQFTTPPYNLSGKSFIYGMYLLPCILFISVVYYLILDLKSRL